MSERRRDVLLCIGVFVVGLGFAVCLHWPALTHYGIYKEDILQSPHWAAYHTSSFRPDDLILRYASFNESPLQNAMHWVATWFVEYVRLSKLLGVVSYGVLSLTFYLVGRAMFGLRFGLLLSLFITFLPDQWEFSAGFFSKFWAIPLLLVCLFLLQTGRFRGLIGLLPFSAIAYPSVAVLIGMTAALEWLQELRRDRSRAARLFRDLALGSLLAVAVLSIKYVAPPDAIGPMRPGAELRAMPELSDGGYPSHYIPIPSLAEELLVHVGHPFVWFSGVFYFLVLGRQGIGWERSWISLLLASAIGYVLADLLFMQLYIPNRYTRYSLAVVLALWNARNWDLILDRVRSRAARAGLAASLLALGGLAYAVTFEQGKGWTDKREMEPVCRFIREELPEGVLIAGSPRRLDDVMLQGQRSVLSPYKLAHPWFVDYYDEIRERTRATLAAHFASGPAPINALHERYGATHFLVQKALFSRARRKQRVFANPYNDEVYRELAGRGDFYLETLPPGVALWEDEDYALIPLPIPSPGR